MPSPIHGCGLEAALAVVGGKWKPIVLWHLAGGACRFGELRRLVVGISEKMLIQQLREMEADRIVARKDFQEIPPRVEYSLTEFGDSLAEGDKLISRIPFSGQIQTQTRPCFLSTDCQAEFRVRFIVDPAGQAEGFAEHLRQNPAALLAHGCITVGLPLKDVELKARRSRVD